MAAPTAFVSTRPQREGEIGIALIFYTNPKELNAYRARVGAEQLEAAVAASIVEQFDLGKKNLADALLAYVTEQQTLIDATT